MLNTKFLILAISCISFNQSFGAVIDDDEINVAPWPPTSRTAPAPRSALQAGSVLGNCLPGGCSTGQSSQSQQQLQERATALLRSYRSTLGSGGCSSLLQNFIYPRGK